MPWSPSKLFESVPERLGTPLAAVATVVAAIGALLIVFATAYGDWLPAVYATVAFIVAGVLWHLADHATRG